MAERCSFLGLITHVEACVIWVAPPGGTLWLAARACTPGGTEGRGQAGEEASSGGKLHPSPVAIAYTALFFLARNCCVWYERWRELEPKWRRRMVVEVSVGWLSWPPFTSHAIAWRTGCGWFPASVRAMHTNILMQTDMRHRLVIQTVGTTEPSPVRGRRTFPVRGRALR